MRLIGVNKARLIRVACALAFLSAARPSSGGARRVVQPRERAARAEEMKSGEHERAGELEAAGVVEARRAASDFAAGDFDDAAWLRARPVKIERYWSGQIAPRERQAEARVVWTDEALYVRFDARQREPLVVSEKPRTDVKTLGLWDRDVCELFVAPDAREPERYFEFEVAPTGEWLDARIHQMPDRRESDFEYRSGATFAARVGRDRITLAMRVPWSALGVAAPRASDEWRANLYRCVGRDPSRGYLAWRPTLTPQPSFHVPQKFGRLRFK